MQAGSASGLGRQGGADDGRRDGAVPGQRVPAVVEGGDGTGSVVVSAKTRFSHELALRVLKAMAARHDIFVCGHVDLGDPGTFETLPWRREGKISEHRCRARLPCHARVYLQWGDLRSRPCVELEVQRFFGVKSPNDKGWIAQIEKLEER